MSGCRSACGNGIAQISFRGGHGNGRVDRGDRDSLIVRIEGADRLWAMKSRLEIPLANVVSAASAGPEAHSWLHGIRAGGAHVPGVISAGRFYSHGQQVFWDVHDPDKAIGIDLRDERYARLVIEVSDPKDEISRIMAAVAGARR
jgi:hypothetical protein